MSNTSLLVLQKIPGLLMALTGLISLVAVRCSLVAHQAWSIGDTETAGVMIGTAILCGLGILGTRELALNLRAVANCHTEALHSR